MSDPEVPIDERVGYLEEEFKTAQKEISRLREELLGTVALLCLPISNSKKLEIGFKLLKKIPDTPLTIILQRYVVEAKLSNLSFDEMISPLVNELGFERTWRLLLHETIKDNYGDWDLNRWKEIEKSHPCEDNR